MFKKFHINPKADTAADPAPVEARPISLTPFRAKRSGAADAPVEQKASSQFVDLLAAEVGETPAPPKPPRMGFRPPPRR